MTNDIPLFTAHDVPDLINSLPTLFGFTPEDSIVAIATSGPRNRFGFRLRMDMPAGKHIGLAAQHIVAHLAHQGAEGAIIIAVTPQRDVAARLVPTIENRLGSIRPIVGVWADGERYWTTFDDCDPGGYRYETSEHHLAVVQAIAEGQEILPNRAALAARLEPESGQRRVWLDRATETVAEEIAATLNTQSGRPVVEIGLADLAPTLEAARAGRRLTDAQAVRLAVWATTTPVRDVLLSLITPESARDMVGLWSHVARSAPPWMSPASLSLAGFASWLSGDGTLALIAAQRALAIDRHHTMASLLLRMLEGGVPPSAWRPFGESERASA